MLKNETFLDDFQPLWVCSNMFCNPSTKKPFRSKPSFSVLAKSFARRRTNKKDVTFFVACYVRLSSLSIQQQLCLSSELMMAKVAHVLGIGLTREKKMRQEIIIKNKWLTNWQNIFVFVKFLTSMASKATEAIS